MSQPRHTSSRIGGALASCLFASALAVACTDFVPVAPYVAPPADASAPPAPSDGGTGIEGGTECDKCLTTTCAGDCPSDKQCWDTIVCAIGDNCFMGKTQSEVIECATPCSDKAGILTASDPPAVKAYALLGCALDQCRSQCQFK